MASEPDSQGGPSEPAPRGRLWRAAKTAVPFALGALALVQPLAKWLARLDWRADLIAHLQEQGLMVTLAAVALLVRRHPRVALPLALLAIAQAWPFVRYEGKNPVAPDPASSQRLRVVVANVLEDNDHYAEITRLIRAERPDIVGLVEVTPDLIANLAEIRAEYPFRAEAPYGSMGLALWFRARPVELSPALCPLPGSWPFLRATFDFAGRARHFWLVHPRSPLHRKGKDAMNIELSALAVQVGSTDGSRIVAGDLNCTDGSPYFADFLRETHLRDSRQGFGREASWPAWLPSPLRIAIDHAFVSDDLAVVARRLGPKIGSDHLPLIFELAPAVMNPALRSRTDAN